MNSKMNEYSRPLVNDMDLKMALTDALAPFHGNPDTEQTRLELRLAASSVLARYSGPKRYTIRVDGPLGKPNVALVEPRVVIPKPAVIDFAGAANKAQFDGLVAWLTEKYGGEIGRFLAARFATAIRKTKDRCIDNLRVADWHNDFECGAYYEAKRRGCCGSVDLLITHYKTGRTFRYGFNYGH